MVGGLERLCLLNASRLDMGRRVNCVSALTLCWAVLPHCELCRRPQPSLLVVFMVMHICFAVGFSESKARDEIKRKMEEIIIMVLGNLANRSTSRGNHHFEHGLHKKPR